MIHLGPDMLYLHTDTSVLKDSLYVIGITLVSQI